MGIARRLSRSTEGSVSIVMGFVFLTIVGAVGGAVDLSNAMRQRVAAQSDLDAALLSAFRGSDVDAMTAAQREDHILDHLRENFSGFPDDARVVISREGEMHMAELSFTSRNTILSAVGFDSFAIDVRSGVTTAPPQPLELALVLDTTASMSFDNRLTTMQGAARDLVNTLTEFEAVRIAMVPFARHINVGVANRTLAGLDIPHDEPDTEICSTTPVTAQTNCRDEEEMCEDSTCSPRTDTCTTDGIEHSCERQDCRVTSTYRCTRSRCDSTPTGEQTTQCNTTTGARWQGCVGSRAYPANIRDTATGGRIPGFLGGGCARPVTRLTTNGATLVGEIDDLVTGDETFIAPALLWGARMISDRIPFPDGVKADRNETIKAIVLMSDGLNTASPSDEGIRHYGTDRDASDDLLIEVCDGIKEDGTVLYTVAYNITDASGLDVLSRCATDPATTFFDARTDRQLVDSFETITRSFQPMRLAR